MGKEWRKKQAAARAEGRWDGRRNRHQLDSGTNNFGQSQIVNPMRIFGEFSGRQNCKLDIYGELSLLSALVRKARVTKPPQRKLSRCPQHPPGPRHRAHGIRHPNATFIPGASGTYASQFAVSGLSAVHGAAQKTEDRDETSGSFPLESKEENLEFGVGQQGPQILAKDSGKSVNYWRLANIVNVNSAVLPAELYETDIELPLHLRAPFKVPDTEKKYGSLTLTYASQLHIAVV